MHTNVENSTNSMASLHLSLSNARSNEYSDAKTALLFDVVSTFVATCDAMVRGRYSNVFGVVASQNAIRLVLSLS